MGEFTISQICKVLKYLTCLLFATTILTYDGYDYEDKFFVVHLTTSRSRFPLPKRFVSIIVSLEVDFQDHTMQFWTTLLASDKPIPSSEILREVTDKWCSNIVRSHLKFYQQQLWDYLSLPCNAKTKDGENKHRYEFVEKTVRLLKLSLEGESNYIQQACEYRLRKNISEDRVGQGFESDLQKSYASCSTGINNHRNMGTLNVQPDELADCRQALNNSEAARQQLNAALMKRQAPPTTGLAAVIQLREELGRCRNTTNKLEKRIVRLRNIVGEQDELINELLREEFTRSHDNSSETPKSSHFFGMESYFKYFNVYDIRSFLGFDMNRNFWQAGYTGPKTKIQK